MTSFLIKETQDKIDILEHSAWKMVQTDEEEFKEKCILN